MPRWQGSFNNLKIASWDCQETTRQAEEFSFKTTNLVSIVESVNDALLPAFVTQSQTRREGQKMGPGILVGRVQNETQTEHCRATAKVRRVFQRPGYGLDDRGSISGGGNVGIFSLRHRVQTGSGDYPASQPMGTGDLSSGVERPGRESDHSPIYSAKVKN
jgi:hypothetical protein